MGAGAAERAGAQTKRIPGFPQVSIPRFPPLFFSFIRIEPSYESNITGQGTEVNMFRIHTIFFI